MKNKLPKTIENPLGEKIIFKDIIHEPDGARVIVEGYCKPNCGPAMHVHFKQDESLTVKKGKLGYQFLGEEEKFISVGETVLFERGKPHRFWNAGSDELKIEGWVKPANSVIFFLTTLYEAQTKSGKPQPEPFDAAYLMTRYKNEYDMPEMPGFVKKVIMPVTYFIGKVLGKYKKFKHSPIPL